jgi:hypothetical protein
VDDLEAIKQLKARYFRLMDTKDWDRFAEVFADDVEVDLTTQGAGVVRGVAEYVPFLRSVIEDVVTVHHGHMPEIELTSSTTATGIWAFEDHLWWPEGSPNRYLHGWGHYHETYSKAEAGWRIQTMRLSRLHRIVT